MLNKNIYNMFLYSTLCGLPSILLAVHTLNKSKYAFFLIIFSIQRIEINAFQLKQFQLLLYFSIYYILRFTFIYSFVQFSFYKQILET